MQPPFLNRRDAGLHLARRLAHLRNQPDWLILALPRGGVPVAHQLSQDLNLPLDLLLVRKLGAPEQPELALGAIAEQGVQVLNTEVIRRLTLSQDVIEEVIRREKQELKRRATLYRGGRELADVRGTSVLLVDDGLATGASMRAAIHALRQMRPATITVAVPTASAEGLETIRPLVDDLVWVIRPDPFYGVGVWYRDFHQVSDSEVNQLLR